MGEIEGDGKDEDEVSEIMLSFLFLTELREDSVTSDLEPLCRGPFWTSFFSFWILLNLIRVGFGGVWEIEAAVGSSLTSGFTCHCCFDNSEWSVGDEHLL